MFNAIDYLIAGSYIGSVIIAFLVKSGGRCSDTNYTESFVIALVWPAYIIFIGLKSMFKKYV